jgi:hypothetical protein
MNSSKRLDLYAYFDCKGAWTYGGGAGRGSGKITYHFPRSHGLGRSGTLAQAVFGCGECEPQYQ